MLKLWNNQCGGEKKKGDGAYAQKKKKKKPKSQNGIHKVMEPREEDDETHGQINT